MTEKHARIADLKIDTNLDVGIDTHRAEFNAIIERSLVAGKVHLAIYARDKDTVEALRELKKLLKESTSESQCVISTSVVPPNLAGLFIRIS
ncbi:MAG: hypothetical protein Q8L47_02025 [bacterium]|nr:hypothetical protein [bacterium]